jgi:hypothetical protein
MQFVRRRTTKLSDPATGTLGKPETLWQNRKQKPGSLQRLVRRILSDRKLTMF